MQTRTALSLEAGGHPNQVRGESGTGSGMDLISFRQDDPHLALKLLAKQVPAPLREDQSRQPAHYQRHNTHKERANQRKECVHEDLEEDESANHDQANRHANDLRKYVA